MTQFDDEIANALGDSSDTPSPLCVGSGSLPSYFDVTGLAVATVSAAAGQLAALVNTSDVVLNQRFALKWFDMTIRPLGWDAASLWDSVAGDYQTADGWIRLHTNAPHHRQAALGVLGCPPERDAVAICVRDWRGEDLEQAVLENRGCAAEMRSLEAWEAHPQGQAVAREPLISWTEHGVATAKQVDLKTLKVLDLTRVLAGPVATRFLAGFGADVLRIDPPVWNEPAVEQEVTLGKRCAGLDLTKRDDRSTFEGLLKTADVLVHGYRPGALDGLGFGTETRHQMNPGLIDVSLCAYGWTGPWAGRRGFDSLVQMSSGIAAAGMAKSGNDRPTPLPVQALDHATGYLMAAAILRALRWRASTGQVMQARLSLARTAQLLLSGGVHTLSDSLAEETEDDLAPEIENTKWGPARRVSFPVMLANRGPHWPHPATSLRHHTPHWR